MKNNKIIFKILILTVILLFTMLINTSEAAFWSNIFEYGDNFLETGANAATQIDPSNLNAGATDKKTRELMDDLYSIVFPLGVVATVVVGAILGIKFMLASAEDKAKVKESMVPYVVGCIVIYGALGIWRICIQIFSALS